MVRKFEILKVHLLVEKTSSTKINFSIEWQKLSLVYWLIELPKKKFLDVKNQLWQAASSVWCVERPLSKGLSSDSISRPIWAPKPNLSHAQYVTCKSIHSLEVL